MPHNSPARVRRQDLLDLKAAGRKFAMLTAYDYPTARLAQSAGVQVLLVGDSLGCVLLGHANTRGVPLDLIVTLAEAVRRGAPGVYLIGDMPFEAMTDDSTVRAAARRFRDEAGCDAIKIEAQRVHGPLVRALADEGFDVVAHLGLRPQTIDTPDGYRAQARDLDEIARLVADAAELVDSGAALVLLEAVPSEAAEAVIAAVDVPVIGCGAGPACDGHVVVTQDMLGLTDIRPPRFVPVLADLGVQMEAAMRRYVEAIASKRYPAAEHVYPMRKQPAKAPLSG